MEESKNEAEKRMAEEVEKKVEVGACPSQKMEKKSLESA